jgi:hypothetical protein
MTSVTIDRPGDRAALRALRGGRRAERLRHMDWIDALYRAYLVGVSTIAALIGLAAAVSDTRLSAATVDDWIAHGPAVVGTVVAVALAFGLRSGSHGGPLVFEAADVQHVMLAPIDRGVVVRATAYRQLRGVLGVGALVGAVAGVTVADRMPHGFDRSPVDWLLAVAACTMLTAIATWGAALLASVLRMSGGLAALLGVVLVAWSVADVVAGRATSPATHIGGIALAPIGGVDPWGVLVVVLLVAAALLRAGNLSLEPALRRARLVQSLRFAATFQDLRAVIVLRHQLAHESPRARPWLRVGRAGGHRGTTWRRDLHGALRWPVPRVVRIATLSVVAGAAAGGAWHGTTPLIAVCALAAYGLALDTTEGFAQDTDHPDIAAGIPEPTGPLLIRHLVTPAAILGGAAILGVGAAAVTAALAGGRAPTGGPAVTAIVAVAAVVTMPAAAALALYLGRPGRDMGMLIQHPGINVALQVAPLIVVALAFAPIVAAVAAPAHSQPVGLAFTAAWPAVIVAGGIIAALRTRPWITR